MLIASWQRWTQPIIDHGREMNLPARILAGEQLYTDVQFLYGPFTPYFNALLYRVFGIHLSTLHTSGAICAFLILLMIYWLARQLMGVWESALTAGVVIVICALKSTANYIQPYSYAALYGLVFALCSLVSTVRYLQLCRSRWMFLAGVCAGLALISKQELAAAALAAAVVALVFSSLAAHKLQWRDLLICTLPVVLISIGAYGWILRNVPWRTLVDLNYVFGANLPPQLSYYNRNLSGLNEWPRSFWYSLTGIGILGMWIGLCLLLGALSSYHRRSEWRAVAGRALGIAILSLAWWKFVSEFFRVRPDTPLASAPFVLPVMVSLLFWQIWRGRREGDSIPLERRLLLVIAVFATVSIARVFFNVTGSGPYTPFFLPTLTIVYLFLLFHLSPAYFVPAGMIRDNARRAAMAVVAITIFIVGLNSARQFRGNNRYEISEQRGSFLVEPRIGEPLAAAIRYAREHTTLDDYVLVLPQGTAINFLAERRYPLRQEIVHPGFLEGRNEADAVQRIVSRRVPLILIDNILTPEIRDQAFGIDFNQNLLRWIQENYRLTARFGPISGREALLGDPEFFILAYELKQSKSENIKIGTNEPRINTDATERHGLNPR